MVRRTGRGIATRNVRVFISYRRGDTSGHAGRLYDALTAEFGEQHVFLDVDKIEPGLDFVEEVKRAVGGCDVLLALMGADWTTMTNPEGGRRLNDPHDFVRLEIEGALERGVRVIPVLVEGARMPAASELPDSMTPLATREALEITDDRWKYDVGRLMGVLHQMQGTSPAAESDVRPEKARSRRRRDVILGASVAVVAILVLLAIVVGTQEDEFPSEDERALLAHVPAFIRDSCERAPDQVGLLAGLRCSPNPRITVSYGQFDQTSVEQVFEAELQEKGPLPNRTCDPVHNREFTGTETYTEQGVARGRFLCYLDGDGVPWMKWTATDLNIGVEAWGAGPDKEALKTEMWELWQKAGPV
jgi:hypothetical protein